MVISVISPHCKYNGNTVTSIMLAAGLANMKKKVLLTHTDSVSDALYKYLGLHQFEDKTSTPTQMVKLLREGAIEGDAIPDYCKNVLDNTYVFTNNKANFSEEDMHTFSQYLVEHSDFDYLIFDFNDEDSKTARYILEHSDVILLNFTPSILELETFKSNLNKYGKMFAGKKLVLVCNKYNSIICKDRDIPKTLGVKAPCNVIHYNNFVVKMCNNGTLLTLIQKARLKTPEVAELNNDMNRLATVISKVRIANLKEKNAAKKEQNAAKKEQNSRKDGGVENA